MTTELRDEISGWFAGAVPADWFVAAPSVRLDREEILVTGELADPKIGAEAGDDERRAARAAHIDRFREETRPRRIAVARDAEHRFDRKVSWAVTCGDVTERFTTAAVPVMTRLRMDERAVLDTLIEAGVARSRSEALAWCVRLVGHHEQEWISRLTDALEAVREARAAGPGLG